MQGCNKLERKGEQQQLHEEGNRDLFFEKLLPYVALVSSLSPFGLGHCRVIKK
jgi:hypothetical protein